MNLTKKGGSIKSDNIFKYIKSIGYEIETIDIVKFNRNRYDGKEILVNTKVTNDQHINQYTEETDELDEYIDIIHTDKDKLEFKITNDAADDTHFNEELEEIVDAVNCDETVFKLTVPKNSYLTQDEYDIKFKDVDGALVNCETFSDVEWIITHYELNTLPNVILDSFSKSMLLLRSHLKELKTIHNSNLLYLDNGDFIKYENIGVNQTYVLPNTPVVYLNSIYTNTDRGEIRAMDYDITQHLEIVVQMTFSCDISYIYRIMKKLLSADFTDANLEKIRGIVERNPHNKNIMDIHELIRSIETGERLDVQIITATLNIVKIMFENYNKTSRYPLPSNEITKKLQMYFFLIFYKIYIYLNFYLTDQEPKQLFKKLSSFMIRHSNYFFYLEIKKLLGRIFPDKSNSEIIKIIEKLVVPLDKNKNFRVLFIDEFMNERTKEVYMNASARYSRNSKTICDPLYSISKYFANFEGAGSEEKRDWLVNNSIDDKSAKYQLYDDTVIVEFRDFPTFLYMQILIDGSDQLCDELLSLPIGVISMKIVNEFIGNKSRARSRRHSKTKHASYSKKTTIKKKYATI